ncbi:Hypothetical protein NTJ_03784 [Nesidiocoris tenuis]|uniref:Uncharacterized protein n=1 Tax=Nesidiocoris tenuis TaxID=355587 RepID=A0ABN7AJB6_9HEMI|nr:Hypothetical protein NTJ_03784 [Nesidiocoris tenuis]
MHTGTRSGLAASTASQLVARPKSRPTRLIFLLMPNRRRHPVYRDECRVVSPGVGLCGGRALPPQGVAFNRKSLRSRGIILMKALIVYPHPTKPPPFACFTTVGSCSPRVYNEIIQTYPHPRRPPFAPTSSPPFGPDPLNNLRHISKQRIKRKR